MSEYKTIVAEAGIGDNLWLLMTLDPAQQYNFEIVGSNINRAHQLFELVPSMVADIAYRKSTRRHEVTHPINLHLETGNRLETFNEVCNWDLPIVTDYYSKDAAKALGEAVTKTGRPRKGATYIGLYGSAMKNVNRKGGAWDGRKWQRFVDWCKTYYKNPIFVGFGADYDDVLDNVELDAYIKGEPLGVAIEAIKRMDLFVGFQSGIPILANYFDVPTIMFYFSTLRKMHETHNKPGVPWKGCTFPSVEDITAWIEKNGFPSKGLAVSGA